MTKGDTWMPLYIGDYLADTMHLTGPEHGAYLLLLIHSWRSGPLLDNERTLASIARTDLPAFRKMWPTLRVFFISKKETTGLLISPRLERERERATQHVNQRRAAGKASAEARARQREVNDRSTAVTVPLERDGRPLPSPLSYPSDRAAADAAPVDTPIADQVWQEGLLLLRKLTAKSDGSCRKFLGKLRKATGNNDALVLGSIRDALEAAPADAEAWLMARTLTLKTGSKDPPMLAALPTEVNGYITTAVLERVLAELEVGEEHFVDARGVVVALLRKGYEPVELYATARALRHRGAVSAMRSAAYLAAAVESRSRKRREQLHERLKLEAPA
jgi:uncharacterized protein YdaU (DUF1376 family)